MTTPVKWSEAIEVEFLAFCACLMEHAISFGSVQFGIVGKLFNRITSLEHVASF